MRELTKEEADYVSVWHNERVVDEEKLLQEHADRPTTFTLANGNTIHFAGPDYALLAIIQEGLSTRREHGWRWSLLKDPVVKAKLQALRESRP